MRQINNNKQSSRGAGVRRASLKSKTGLVVRVARSAGFCFGVKRAIRMARDLADSGAEVRMLGDIVHNEEVIRGLEAAGIRKLRRLGQGRGCTLLIRAHGAPACLPAAARRRGYRIVDATCPMVREIHRLVRRMAAAGRVVIVIGDRKHDEVAGIVGQCPRSAIVLDVSEPLPERRLRRIRRAAIVVQSTQNEARALALVEAIRALVPDLRFFNTICRPTRLKQQEVRVLPLNSDVVVVIGSRTSANTRRLYEIARSLNRRTHWIQTASGLRRAWFRNASTVGVTAGASTPEEIIRGVVGAIRAQRGA